MPYAQTDFIPFSADAQRVVANVEQAYAAWLDARREVEALPVSMYWAARGESEYLMAKAQSSDSGKSLGKRSSATEATLAAFQTQKEAARTRLASLDTLLNERVSLYRKLRLPALPDRQAEILRKLDAAELLGSDFMVVGTNAFAAYELACGARFPVGAEETEDFDLAWCRATGAASVSLVRRESGSAAKRYKSLLGLLQSIDASYRINRRKPYQAIAADGYEVELLAAPSTHPLPPDEEFDPMASLIEQEWLLNGSAISVVVATVRGRACPLYVPDPRWMALHKLWLADKPERRPAKRGKDARQGEVLLDAARYFLTASHPLNLDFVLDLPEELRAYFDRWATARGYVPI